MVSEESVIPGIGMGRSVPLGLPGAMRRVRRIPWRAKGKGLWVELGKLSHWQSSQNNSFPALVQKS